MDKIILEIKKYIIFLKQTCKLEVTLHPCENEQLISNSELISFNIHENPYCIYVKTFPDAFRHCIERQKDILKKCVNGSFCGTCYAGVYEYVYPILNSNNIVGFISVSGYRNEHYASYIDRCSNNYGIPRENLQKTIQCIKKEFPNKSYVDTLVTPLVRMLELAYINLGNIKKENNTIEEIIRYINRHHSENITIEQICKVFSCSRSYVCHAVKKETGQTIHGYLTNMRIKSAKSLLLYSNLSISEIAFSVGFNDSNYFSYKFKSHTGISPRKYRNMILKNKPGILNKTV